MTKSRSRVQKCYKIVNLSEKSHNIVQKCYKNVNLSDKKSQHSAKMLQKCKFK